MAQSPLAQFEIHDVAPLSAGGFDVSFTNSAMWMVAVLGIIWIFMVGGTRKAALVPGRWQAAVESVYGFIDNTLSANVGPEGRRFVPLIFSLFMFIIVANFAGLLPVGVVPGVHAFTVTSHVTVTAMLALISFATVLFVGFARHGLHFFSLFVPHGVPAWMLPIIVPVELISFMIRPFSLALRLFVAMTAGHILLKVLAGFIVGLGATGGAAAFVTLPTLALLVGISALELLVAAIQAYVFALLTSLYLNDAIHLH
ncbi:F0F1 ATP synthase subunit A [Tardibacter chloracetimidivorans]|uniref:ATP synthase subunit a n=1 Tax=Tardibacter chloracetimidivorans TaxID=1921510 RepID=A0A1L3ZQP6_9SPHN|nr:F0F1 ATP synthase subunit A [Tardibacter chloracetimidivorans]API57945.1 F0F1 ATP synthase subunit A [Tardibacter chloracetimidivorans]